MESKSVTLSGEMPGSTSSVEDVTSRNIPDKVRLHLFVVAGGHCEFAGCNDYLMEHHLTLAPGNFAQAAHIVAFKEKGPRGNVPDRPDDINSITNLMLLCPKCHKLIDDHPLDHPRERLEVMKRTHEMRIKLVTSMGPEMRTSLLIFQAPIGGHHIDISQDDVRKALNPRQPASLPGTVIDLSNLAGSADNTLLAVAQDQIQRNLVTLFKTGGEADEISHLSVFAIGPITLLVALGSKLSNKISADFYQRHRDTEDWIWKTTGTAAQYTVIRHTEADRTGPVALVLSLSGKIDISTLPDEFTKQGSVYEILLTSQTPTPTFLRQRRDLEAFRIAYQEALATITKEHGVIEKLALFPAVPAPVAVLCGRERLPKIHPALHVYDYDKTTGGFTYQVEVI